MVDKRVLNYDVKLLTAWLSWKAGSSNPDYFGAHKGDCSLELQQVPQEYAQLLDWFRKQKFESYLELGVGRGGSFLLNVMFQPNLQEATAVDNSEYWKQEQKESIEDKIDWIKANKEDCITSFMPYSTDEFFDTLGKVENQTFGGEKQGDIKYDCVFIDADHSYEGVKKDFDNSLKHIKDGGFIIFHDIASVACPGVQRTWKEASEKYKVAATFVHGGNCGIGIIQVGAVVSWKSEMYLRDEKTNSMYKMSPEIAPLTQIEKMMLNKSKYGVLLIETRPEINIQEVSERHTKYLPESWGLTVIGSKETEMVCCPALNRIYLNVKGFDVSILNKWLTSSYFWSLIPHEKVLIIQPDSGFLREGIEEFLGYDFVGAPHTFCEWTANGGLSLRTVDVMKRICETHTYQGESVHGNCDIWFTNIMHKERIGKLAPREVNSKFSCESIFQLGTLGYHAIDKYLTKEQCETILTQYK